MGLRSTQPQTKMTTRGHKGGQYMGLTTLPPSCADYLEILEASTSWSAKGMYRPVTGYLHFLFYYLFFPVQYRNSEIVCTRILVFYACRLSSNFYTAR
jgi:hypothetical protein